MIIVILDVAEEPVEPITPLYSRAHDTSVFTVLPRSVDPSETVGGGLRVFGGVVAYL